MAGHAEQTFRPLYTEELFRSTAGCEMLDSCFGSWWPEGGGWRGGSVGGQSSPVCCCKCKSDWSDVTGEMSQIERPCVCGMGKGTSQQPLKPVSVGEGRLKGRRAEAEQV